MTSLRALVLSLVLTGICAAAQAAPATRATCEPIGQPDCRSVVRYANPNAHNRAFNRSMSDNKTSGTVMACRRLIDLPTGTAQGNHSFGGDCTLKQGRIRTPVLICHDTMVGHFAVKKLEGQPAPTESALIAFTDEQCFGG